jgi:hypothetical protein
MRPGCAFNQKVHELARGLRISLARKQNGPRFKSYEKINVSDDGIGLGLHRAFERLQSKHTDTFR